MRQLFKGGNYSREETINLYEFFTAETIQRRKLFKGGNYSRKYGIQFLRSQNILNLYTFTILCTGLKTNKGKYSREDTPM